MVVRNNLEDFHCKHLSDEQMKELNPLIRNAVFTALTVLSDIDHPLNDHYTKIVIEMIPEYWEEPELTNDYESLLYDYHGLVEVDKKWFRKFLDKHKPK